LNLSGLAGNDVSDDLELAAIHPDRSTNAALTIDTKLARQRLDLLAVRRNHELTTVIDNLENVLSLNHARARIDGNEPLGVHALYMGATHADNETLNVLASHGLDAFDDVIDGRGGLFEVAHDSTPHALARGSCEAANIEATGAIGLSGQANRLRRAEIQ